MKFEPITLPATCPRRVGAELAARIVGIGETALLDEPLEMTVVTPLGPIVVTPPAPLESLDGLLLTIRICFDLLVF